MEFTPKHIAELLGGKTEGDASRPLSRFAKIEEAREGDLTFLANPKYEQYVYTCKASAILVREDFIPQHPVAATLIRVSDPYEALATLMNMLQSLKPSKKGIEQPSYIADGVRITEDCYIGAFAYIGANAAIGRGVKIYPQTYVGEGVSIGDGSVLYPGVKVYEGCVIGRNCIIHAGASIGADGFGFAPSPQGYEKIPQIGNVVIEDDVEIGANTTIDRATFGSTVIGKGTKLDNLVQIAHNVELGQHNVFAAQVGVAGSAKIGNWNRIGGQVGIAGHIQVGDNNEVGAQSGIPKSVGSNNRLMGYPAVDFRDFARGVAFLKSLSKKK